MTAPTLTEFLLARIADDEAAAKAATRGPWISRGSDVAMTTSDGYWLGVAQLGDDDKSPKDAAHIARQNPARVLAECEAKRRIVDECEDERQRMDIYNRDYPLGLLTTDGDLRARLSSNARWAGLDVAVRALVQPYADHPDYDEAWRP